jgi:3-oxoacyl-(acyl-carrier-protein) synthase
VNAHGTGTRQNDQMEGAALRRAFGADAGSVSVTSTKPFTGHRCGAAGATELICAIEGLRGDFQPATLGLETPDPRLADLDFVRGPARDVRHDTALSMNSGFGGTNAAVLVRRIPSWN